MLGDLILHKTLRSNGHERKQRYIRIGGGGRVWLLGAPRPKQARVDRAPGVVGTRAPHRASCNAAHGARLTALAPDLYHGKSTVEEAEAAHLMQGLDWGKAAKEISGAIRHLREAEDCTTIGVVGFCMGGALTLISALDPAVDAYVAYYGFPPAGAAPVEKIAAPGLIFFGEDEGYFSVPDAQAFAKAQTGRGCPTDVVVYPGAGHGFFNDERPAAFRQDAANDAWRRTLEHSDGI